MLVCKRTVLLFSFYLLSQLTFLVFPYSHTQRLSNFYSSIIFQLLIYSYFLTTLIPLSLYTNNLHTTLTFRSSNLHLILTSRTQTLVLSFDRITLISLSPDNYYTFILRLFHFHPNFTKLISYSQLTLEL